ncbi:MAG: hypothetical protein H6Q90_4558 [Deltaproteobacteria bacterium]|nr:hypothetical protein [Deltaproteobacteria bacterium]
MRRLVILMLALLFARSADAKPRLELAARQGRIIVFAESGLEATARELAESAEATLLEISADLPGLSTPAAIEVHLVRDAVDLASVAPGGRGAPPWAVGVAYPDLGVISVALRRGAHPTDAEATLKHELAHVALGAALGAHAPHWLHEGFAYQHSAEWSRERLETLAGMAWLGSVIPLQELDDSFPAEELVANRAYAESYDFVGFLAKRGRWEDHSDDGDRYPFRRFLSEISRGAAPDAAATRAYGRPLKTLFEEWREDLDNRYKLMPVGLLGLALWALCGLLLMLAWWRRRRQNRRRIAQWDFEDAARRAQHEAEAAAAASSLVNVPRYIPWPGEDPLDEDPEEPTDSAPPRLLN